MFKTSGGERLQYATQKWYQYEANRLKHNINDFNKLFPGRKIIDHFR